MQAFLTGDDVYQQRDAMLKACEQSGPGTLVHPTLGSDSMRADRIPMLRPPRARARRRNSIQFIVPGTWIFLRQRPRPRRTNRRRRQAPPPASSDLGSALSKVGKVATEVTSTVEQICRRGAAYRRDACSIFNSVRGLAGGYFGRYSTGSRSVLQPLMRRSAGSAPRHPRARWSTRLPR